ncbi:MAG: PHP domain-containing protein [Treponema sp.]|nr:PHP domain-containing protein [Treponema sp.]
MTYLYETHLHTAGVSKCASSRGADYIAGYLDKGYSGIIVTDHFFNANCAISRKLPWHEWVNCFYRGYEDAKEEGDRRGLDVFFGWEETFEGCDDYLIYGLDKEWLMEHPEVRNWTRGEQYRAVREAGGCVVQAHPFRQRSYIQRVVLSTSCADAVEVFNGGNDCAAFDALAYRYAKKLGKPEIAGSDIHDASSIYNGNIFGVYSNKKLNGISDFVSLILNNEVAGLKADESRMESFCENDVYLPVEVRGENDRITGKNWKQYVF